MNRKYDEQYLNALFRMVDVPALLEKYHANIVGNEVRTHKGRELRMHCIMPGHRDNDASASFNLEKGLYNCWSKCGGLTFWNLIQQMENLPNFPAAVEFIQKLVGFDDDGEIDELALLKDRIERLQFAPEIEDTSMNVEYTEIKLEDHPEFETALNHMEIVKSRVTESMVKFWDLRYAVSGFYKGRLIIPFRVNGKVVSFAARDMTGRCDKWKRIQARAKKLNLTKSEYDDLSKQYKVQKIVYPATADFGSRHIRGTPVQFILFNLDEVLEYGKENDYVIITEGPFDAMRLFSWGYNAVAVLGLNLATFKRSKILENFSKVYVCLDNDSKEDGSNPGQEAAAKMVDSLVGNVSVLNVVLPKGKDPDDCTQDEFESYLKSAIEF